MPYKSDKQRRFMHAKHPEIAARWDAEIRAKKKVAKRMDPDKRLRAQKKIQAGTSIAGSTVGLTGLGMLAASRTHPGALKQLPKVTALGGGIGGVGGFNFASIQNQEAKKKPPRQNVFVVRNKKQIKNIKSGLQPVTKGFTMDFGLSGVRQGEDVEVISKRKYDTEASLAADKKAHRNAGGAQTAGTVGLGGVIVRNTASATADINYLRGKSAPYKSQKYNLKAQNKTIREAYTTATKAGWNGHEPLKRRATVKPMAKFAVRAAKNNPHATAGRAGVGVAAVGIPTAFALAHRASKQRDEASRLRSVERRKQIGKSQSWMNISEHERRARDSRRTGKRGEAMAGVGGTVIGGAVAHNIQSGMKKGSTFEQAGRAGKNLKTTAQNVPAIRRLGNSWERTAKFTGNSLKMTAKDAPHGTAALAGGALLAGGVATRIAARSNEKRHDRAIAQLRRKRVAKAYNPEDKRLRRTENTATALSVGSGASATGAFMFGRKAVGAKGTGMKGLRAKSLPHFKVGLKNAGKAGGLGATAVGLAVASDRVRNYRHGSGNTYRQLHR